MTAPAPRPANLEPLRTWKHATLADTGVAEPVTCGCGRVHQPESMLSTAGLPEGIPAAQGAPYICVVCVSGSWKPRTAADDGVTGNLPHGKMRCRCGRPRLPDEMFYVKGILDAEGYDYLGGCCLPGADQVDLYRLLGAPQYWLDWWEGKLLRAWLHRRGLPPHIWGEILARTFDAAAAAALEARPQ